MATQKQPANLESLPASTVIQTLVVNPARINTQDINDWKIAINNAKYGYRTQLYNMYENLLSDGVLSSAIDKRVRAITNANIVFQKDDKPIPEIDDIIDTIEFEELIKEIALSRAWGKSVIDIQFTPAFNAFSFPRKNIVISNIQGRPLSEKKKVIASYEGFQNGYDYTQDEFIIECGKDDDLGYIYKACQYAIYKRGGFGDYAEFVEVFGNPFILGKYNSSDTTQRDELFKSLKEIGSQPRAAVPKESDVEVINTTSSGNVDLFEKFRKACNEEMLITVIGQTMTTTSGSSRSQAEVHEGVLEEIFKDDSRYVRRVLNQKLIPLLIKRGYDVAGGKFMFPDAGESISTSDKIKNAIAIKTEAGIPVPDSYFYETSGIPKPEATDTVTELPKSAPSPAPAPTPEPDPEPDSEPVPTPDKTKLADSDRNLFLRLFDFFGVARTTRSRANLNLQDKSTLSIPGIDTNKLFNQALNNIYKQYVDDPSAMPLVDKSLFDISNSAYQHAVDTEFKSMGVEFGKTNADFIAQFKTNVAVFAAFKNHRQTQDIVNMLTDEKGNLRSFYDFKKQVATIDADYNQRWLQTEYNTAVRASRMAAKIKQFQTVADLYPNLEYMESTAVNKREEHEQWVGTILPINHPWWDTHLPPSDWGCECSIRNTDAEPTEVPEEGEGLDPVFQNNPAKTAEMVNMAEHSYVKGVDKKTAAIISKFALINQVVQSLQESAGFKLEKKFNNGGKLMIHELINKNNSDYKLVKNVAVEFARTGADVKMTPNIHYKSEEWTQIYNFPEGSVYYRKCPDLLINGEFYEVEDFLPKWNKKKINRMISHGTDQAARIVINNNKGCSDRYIRKITFDRIKTGKEILEVWVYEKGAVRQLF